MKAAVGSSSRCFGIFGAIKNQQWISVVLFLANKDLETLLINS